METLMERAGLGVALAAVDLGVGYGSRVVVLAGSGNNGGDGYVAARYLARRGVSVVVHKLGSPKDPVSAAGLVQRRARSAGVRIVPLGAPEPADLVIDALFGVGFRGALPDDVVPWTTSGHRVLAVDVPSGLDAASGVAAGPVFSAVATVTFHALKPGHILGSGARSMRADHGGGHRPRRWTSHAAGVRCIRCPATDTIADLRTSGRPAPLPLSVVRPASRGRRCSRQCRRWQWGAARSPWSAPVPSSRRMRRNRST